MSLTLKLSSAGLVKTGFQMKRRVGLVFFVTSCDGFQYVYLIGFFFLLDCFTILNDSSGPGLSGQEIKCLQSRLISTHGSAGFTH